MRFPLCHREAVIIKGQGNRRRARIRLSGGCRMLIGQPIICVWSKANAGMGSFYRSQHEFVCVFKSGNAPHVNNIELGKYGRYRTNIWTYAGVNGFGDGRSDLELHPTVKPVAMVADAIRDCSRRKGIILDPFAGSASTLIAAERTGRPGFGTELDPLSF